MGPDCAIGLKCVANCHGHTCAATALCDSDATCPKGQVCNVAATDDLATAVTGEGYCVPPGQVGDICRRDQDCATGLLPKLNERAAELDAYSLSVLVLANVRAGKADDAKRLAEQLVAQAVSDDTGVHFQPHGDHYGWADNPKESTGYAVRALVATGVGKDVVAGAVTWLMAHRRGGMWDTTKDTAAVLEALTDVADASGELTGSYNATLNLNGVTLGTLAVEPKTAGAAHFESTVAAAKLHTGANELALTVDGKGTLYWTGALSFGDEPKKTGSTLQVDRAYMRIVQTVAADGTVTERAEKAETLSTGDIVEVRLTLTAARAFEFVAVEDLLPAGFEVQPGDAPAEFANRTDRDDRVAFFATHVNKGTTSLSYRLRAEVAGSANASPAVAWLMYLPDTYGSSAPATLTTVQSN